MDVSVSSQDPFGMTAKHAGASVLDDCHCALFRFKASHFQMKADNGMSKKVDHMHVNQKRVNKVYTDDLLSWGL